jgi:hypothetical protein
VVVDAMVDLIAAKRRFSMAERVKTGSF